MKKIFQYIIPVVVIGISACNYTDTKTRGYEYMPDMYISPSYETYSTNPLFADSMEARQPVAGTVARGDAIFTDYDRLPYPYPNTPEGYEAAGTALQNPIEKNDVNMAEGQRLFMNYCKHCHGETGQGDGLVTQAPHNGPKPPPYNGDQLKNLPVGKMFHTITWGKNMMGSHASQLTPTQRWKIIMFVQTLQHPAGAEASADSTKTTAPAEKKK
jgi:mono/diheme cytochrome c family protein